MCSGVFEFNSHNVTEVELHGNGFNVYVYVYVCVFERKCVVTRHTLLNMISSRERNWWEKGNQIMELHRKRQRFLFVFSFSFFLTFGFVVIVFGMFLHHLRTK